MNEYPTYGELIDLFEFLAPGDATLLVSKFNALYPNVTTGRPGRFFDTVLAIPTKPSIRGKSAKLQGSPIQEENMGTSCEEHGSRLIE